jgi:rhodanese-related sulfurtransferase
MIQFLKRLFGISAASDFAELVKNGAKIIDVRSPGEFASGHIQQAVNIPVDQLSGKLNLLKDKQQVIITCCASGMRSAAAKRVLQSSGYVNVHNGGSWQGLQQKMKS